MAGITLLRKAGMAALALAGAVVLHSCETIFEYEGDCSVNYLVDFCYDINMKYADAFAAESGKVMLYAFDQDGSLVWQKTEEGDCLAEEDYAMRLDLEPGLYDLVSWSVCDIADECFNIPLTKSPALTKEELMCELVRKADPEGRDYSDRHLGSLLHGCIEDLEIGETEGTYVSRMHMTKNTNQVRVVLQNLSGKELRKDDFNISITESNGLMGWDNSLRPCAEIDYSPWRLDSGMIGEPGSGDAVTTASAVVAELTLGRLMADRKTRLNVTDKEGKVVISIPLVDYALLVKGHYENMTDQEYLDRQDVYELVFFLDSDLEWLSTHIFINSWKVVLSDVELD